MLNAQMNFLAASAVLAALSLPSYSLRDSEHCKPARVADLPEPHQAELDAVWDGMDVIEDVDTRAGAAEGAKRRANKAGVQLLGPPDSGTNLIVRMFELNWPGVFHGMLDDVVWKHSIDTAEAIRDLFAEKVNVRNTTLIIAVRSPVAQMEAWMRQPYSLYPCFRRNFEEWKSPCVCNTKPNWHDTTPGAYIHPTVSNKFESSADVYNQYLQLYLGLKAQGVFKNVLIAPYEDTVLEPGAVFEEWAGKIGLEIPSNGIQVYGASAKQEYGRGREAALHKLQTRPWLNVLKGVLPTVCGQLSNKSLAQFHYGRFSEHSHPYAEDCLGVGGM